MPVTPNSTRRLQNEQRKYGRKEFIKSKEKDFSPAQKVEILKEFEVGIACTALAEKKRKHA